MEEREILPLALKVLSRQDWAELDEAFATNKDPLSGYKPDAEYQELFQKVLRTVPAPIGLGPTP